MRTCSNCGAGLWDKDPFLHYEICPNCEKVFFRGTDIDVIEFQRTVLSLLFSEYSDAIKKGGT